MTARPAEKWIPEDTFGDRLRRLRRAANLSQVDFANAIDATHQAVASWEIGTREPRSVVAVAKRVELAFNVPAGWLLGLDVEVPSPPDGGPAGDGSTPGYSNRVKDLRPRVSGSPVLTASAMKRDAA